jgi:molybdate transport system substrate-binding protein
MLTAIPDLLLAGAKAPLTVFAAVSLSDVLREIGARFEQTAGVPVRFSFAASSALARQIENGAAADVFFSADLEWMDYLQKRNLIQIASRRNVVGNQLVLVAPANSTVQLNIAPHFALVSALGAGRLSTGDPDSVPAGRYARAALLSLGVWNEVANRLVFADNARSALVFVARGEAPLGIVYRTDALLDKRVRIVDVFPDNSHTPIAYPVALCLSNRIEATQFVDYLGAPAARATFTKYGFVTLR